MNHLPKHGIFFTARNVILFFLLSSLPFMFCSKGNNGITPILPPEDTEYSGGGGESSETINLALTRESYEDNLKFHPQLSPIMSVETFNDIEEKVFQRIGLNEFPQDQLMYLFTEPVEIAEFNPPVICFAFAAPENMISPDDITVLLDREDISKRIRYNCYYHQGRKANYYLGNYIPENYLNPGMAHNVNISFQPKNAQILNKNINFGVPQVNNLKVARAGFVSEKEKRIIDFRKLVVFVDFPYYVNIGQKLLQIENWEFIYKNGRTAPGIQSIEKIAEKIFIISFDQNFESDQEIKISYTPSDGVYSNIYEMVTPKESVDRGGGSYRKVQSNCIEGSFTNHVAHESQDCEENHYLQLYVDCPDRPCYGQIEEEIRGNSYSFTNQYLKRGIDSETGIAQGFTPTIHVHECSNSPRFTYDHANDITAKYRLYGYDRQGNSALLDTLEGIIFESDTTPPLVNAEVSEETKCPDPDNPNCEPCEKFKKYMITVTGTDEHCIRSWLPKFVLFYPAQLLGEPIVLILDIRHMPPMTDHYFETRFFIDQEILGCVEYMKIVMWDLKGNWNSTKLYNIGFIPDDPPFSEDKLPFPSSITLSFDESKREGYKQYVNLDYTIETQNSELCRIFDDVCEFKSDHPDHGSFIYIEVSVDPPIQGVWVYLQYEDPPFDDNSDDPSNKKQPGNLKYSSSNNPDLYSDEEKLLWDSHGAWGGDGVTFGDNYNYYHNCGAWNSVEFKWYCDYYGVPADDPIRKHPPGPKPCFYNCMLPISDPPCICTNPQCVAPYATLKTNIFGKAAIFFATGGHGGDNFKFKAFFVKKDGSKICNEIVSETFTVWRRITVDYAWMRVRTKYPRDWCQYNGDDQLEHIYDHEIGEGGDRIFQHLQGVYDDCFLEIVKGTEYMNQNYQLSMDGSDGPNYWIYPIWWEPAQKDTVLLIGVDQILNQCLSKIDSSGDEVPSGPFGYTPVENTAEKNYWCYTAVGFISDWVENKLRRKIDDIDYDTYYYPSMNSAAHELLHDIRQKGNDIHDGVNPNDIPYGLMCPGEVINVEFLRENETESRMVPARRSYLNSRKIMDLRRSLEEPFEGNEY